MHLGRLVLGETNAMNSTFDVDWRVDRQEWISRAQADSDCTIFQTPFWADVVLGAEDAEAVRVVAARFRSGSIVLLPLAQTWRSRRSGLASFVSMAVSVYGGPIVNGPLSAVEISSALSIICRHHQLGAQSVTLIGSPNRNVHLEHPFNASTLTAHVLLLDSCQGHPEKGFSESFRRDLKIARKAGVTVRGSTTLDDLMTYYSLYDDSLKRWGNAATSRHSKSLFVALARMPADAFRVWLGEVDGVAVAGVVMFYKGDTAYYWHGAFHSDYSRIMPSKAVLDAAVTDAAQRGYQRVDMLSSGGHKGVIQLKESMGAMPQKFTINEWATSGLDRILRAASHKFRVRRPW